MAESIKSKVPWRSDTVHCFSYKHWRALKKVRVCIQNKQKERVFMLVLLSYATHFYRKLWMPEIYTGSKVIRHIKDKNEGRTTKCHWSLEAWRTQQIALLPPALLHRSLGSRLWATTRNRIVSEMNFILTTKKPKKFARFLVNSVS